jgi:DNA polymerase-3 subunit alpha
MSAELVHLHVHSEFSMLDGAIRLKKLAQRAAALGQKAVALTDHANMHGTLQFVGACKDAGVKPIVGCEVNLVTGSRKDTTPRPHTHLVLLAENMEGYANLSRIVSLGWVDGMHDGAARVDLELLEQNRAGLIATTACMGGWVAQEILLKGEEAGRSALGRLSDVMGKGNLFVELQDHGLPEQEALNEILAAMAESMDLPIVATNDCHYLEQKEARAQIVLQCIGASRQLVDMERAHHGSSEMFLKSAEEMAERFSDYPQALANTLLVAERCAGQREPQAQAKAAALLGARGRHRGRLDAATLAREGLEARFAEIQKTGRAIDTNAYRARLDFETKTIVSMGFPGYFLIVQDFINWAKKTTMCPSAPAAARVRARSSRTRCASRTSTRSLRPPLRALPEPRARVHARLRRRLLHGPSASASSSTCAASTATTRWGRSRPSTSSRARASSRTWAARSACSPSTRTASPRWSPTPCRARPSPSPRPWSRSPSSRRRTRKRRPSRSSSTRR